MQCFKQAQNDKTQLENVQSLYYTHSHSNWIIQTHYNIHSHRLLKAMHNLLCEI